MSKTRISSEKNQENVNPEKQWMDTLASTRRMLQEGWLLMDRFLPGIYEKEKQKNFGFPEETPITTLSPSLAVVMEYKTYPIEEYIDVQLEGEEKARWMSREEFKKHLGVDLVKGFVCNVEDEKTIKATLSRLKKQQKRRLEKYEECRDLKRRVNYFLRHPRNLLAVRPMPGMGNGLIVRQKIFAGTIVGIFFGKLCEDSKDVHTGGDASTLLSNAGRIGGLLRFIQWTVMDVGHAPEAKITSSQSSAHVPRIEDILSANITSEIFIDEDTGVPMQVFMAKRDIEVGEILLQGADEDHLVDYLAVAKETKSNSYVTLQPFFNMMAFTMIESIAGYEVRGHFTVAPPLQTPQPNAKQAQQSSKFFAKEKGVLQTSVAAPASTLRSTLTNP